MEQSIINKIKGDLNYKDFLFEDNDFYPQELLSYINCYTYDSNTIELAVQKFFDYLIKHDFSLVAYHGTRLFQEEYENLNKIGFQITDINFFLNKLNSIPESHIKKNLVKYVKKLKEADMRSNGDIYFKYGNNNFSQNIEDCIFLNNWGGETIYCFYDKGGSENKELKEFGNILRRLSKPYIIIARMKFIDILNSDNKYIIAEDIKKIVLGDVENVGETIKIPPNKVEIIKIIEATREVFPYMQ